MYTPQSSKHYNKLNPLIFIRAPNSFTSITSTRVILTVLLNEKQKKITQFFHNSVKHFNKHIMSKKQGENFAHIVLMYSMYFNSSTEEWNWKKEKVIDLLWVLKILGKIKLEKLWGFKMMKLLGIRPPRVRIRLRESSTSVYCRTVEKTKTRIHWPLPC